MGVVKELQRDALSTSVPVTDLLRKGLLVAQKLQIEDFERWIKNELYGYQNSSDVPKYRQIKGHIRAFNPYNNYWMPIHNEPEYDEQMERLTKKPIMQSVSSIQKLLEDNPKPNGRFMVPFNEKLTRSLTNGEYECALHVASNLMQEILDGVRNLVLEWAIKLEKEGILGKDLTFSEEEKEKAQNNSQVHINNFQGVLGNVTNTQLTQNLEITVNENDFSSLAEYLKQQGVGENDVKELEEAINKDGEIKPEEGFGKNVGEWFGKMVSKAASGTWKITVSVAANMLNKAIMAYYGQGLV